MIWEAVSGFDIRKQGIPLYWKLLNGWPLISDGLPRINNGVKEINKNQHMQYHMRRPKKELLQNYFKKIRRINQGFRRKINKNLAEN